MKVFLHHLADKYLNRLQPADRDRINAALGDLEEEPPKGDIKPLTGQSGRFRVRVGSYRILFRIKDDTILVTHIGPRGQAYNKNN
jgi:mRNA interferase RelE/StbE